MLCAVRCGPQGCIPSFQDIRLLLQEDARRQGALPAPQSPLSLSGWMSSGVVK